MWTGQVYYKNRPHPVNGGTEWMPSDFRRFSLTTGPGAHRGGRQRHRRLLRCAPAMAAQPRTAAFTFVFVTVLLDMLALGAIIPVLPKLIAGFYGGDLAQAAKMVGIFGTIFAGMQFFCAPMLGSLSDRVG